MTATIVPIDGDQVENSALADLVNACFGVEEALSIVKPDHVGGIMTTALVEHPRWVDYELAVVKYRGAGYQMFIGPREGDAIACIDLHTAATSNADPDFLSEVQRKVDLYLDDEDALAGDLLSHAAEIYAAA